MKITLLCEVHSSECECDLVFPFLFLPSLTKFILDRMGKMNNNYIVLGMQRYITADDGIETSKREKSVSS